MNKTLPIFAAVATSLALAACTGGRSPIPRAAIDRALSSAPYAAQPSLVVAREVEFARAAREDGQWTAFRAFAANDAVIHGRGGPVPAGQVIAGLSDPPEPTQWSPRTVLMSCDGKLAVSRGRFLDPEGYVGTYVTVWSREDYDDEYHWVYDVGGRDDPQPSSEEAEESTIVVTAYDDIHGLVADCPRGGAEVPSAPFVGPPASGRAGEQTSPDGTLRWRWEHWADGTKYVRADYYTSGAWETVIEESLASPPR